MASDFTTSPDYVFDESIQNRTLVSEFENGTEQRRNVWNAPRRKWRLVFRNRSTSDFETVRDFYIAQKGAYDSFTWTNPNDNVEYTVRFVEDTLQFSRSAYGIYSFDFEIVEVK